ncbi:heavy-metal-associated domain-containing protein [Niabella soli]|uniref:Heavy metal-associated protein n=1 Tax=Niabella soli DSM 19437 TaxID=929713 RepID=W0F223_9BACT|nr:cation transporter [Niabella soli]AHF15843.1 heavy metal-associated protein [Niabella soli DSM 19437]
MDIVKFKTNLKCEGCISKVTPALNSINGVKDWAVDLKDTDRILTITGSAIAEKAVVQALLQNGYKAEKAG